MWKTIDYLREKKIFEEFLDVFVVDAEDKPIGVISLSVFCVSRPLMREICDETQVNVPAEMMQEEVALLEKYDLTTAGVVDQMASFLE